MTHSNDQGFSFDLYPGLDSELSAAYDRNVASGQDQPIDAPGLAGVIATAQAAAPNRIGEFGLNADFKAAAETAQDTARSFADHAGLATPKLEELAEAGIDFSKLANSYEEMQRLDLEPKIVIAPILELAQWRNIFKAIEADLLINADGHIKSGGLSVERSISDNWETLNSDKHAVSAGGGLWEVMIIPNTQEPSLLKITHGDRYDGPSDKLQVFRNQINTCIPSEQRIPEHMHSSIAGYLALQAGNLINLENPIDDNTHTWLDGTFDTALNSHAPAGCWNTGQVHLEGYSAHTIDTWLGIRPTAWGKIN